MSDLEVALDSLAAQTAFSGVVRIDVGDRVELLKSYGLAHRGYRIANRADTQFAIASGTKGLTALTMVSLIESGLLTLSTTARSVLGDDLPLIDDEVTIDQLLAHRSGIGDYLDEETALDLDDHLMQVPVCELATTEQYLRVLAGHETKFPPGERFSYSNSGYVVLALIAERVTGLTFHELVQQRVCVPAGMGDTAFQRSDELSPRAAIGYLEVDGVSRTNVFHLPVRGNGDGGAYTTVADVRLLWEAFFAGRIVSRSWVDEILRPRDETVANGSRVGLGIWLDEATDAVRLEGCDTGVSFHTVHSPRSRVTRTVISNTARGAWPISRLIAEKVGS